MLMRRLGIWMSAVMLAASPLHAQEKPSAASEANPDTAPLRTAAQKQDHFQEAMRLDSFGATTTAREMLQSSCFSDEHAEGCNNFAYMALFGEGGTVDEPLARQSYAKGCALLLRESCMSYADMMREGRGGDIDMPTALGIYYRQCQQGFGKACHNAALMIETGLGVTQADAAKALEGFQAGCTFGFQPSCKASEKRSQVSPQPKEE